MIIKQLNRTQIKKYGMLMKINKVFLKREFKNVNLIKMGCRQSKVNFTKTISIIPIRYGIEIWTYGAISILPLFHTNFDWWFFFIFLLSLFLDFFLPCYKFKKLNIEKYKKSQHSKLYFSFNLKKSIGYF